MFSDLPSCSSHQPIIQFDDNDLLFTFNKQKVLFVCLFLRKEAPTSRNLFFGNKFSEQLPFCSFQFGLKLDTMEIKVKVNLPHGKIFVEHMQPFRTTLFVGFNLNPSTLGRSSEFEDRKQFLALQDRPRLQPTTMTMTMRKVINIQNCVNFTIISVNTDRSMAEFGISQTSSQNFGKCCILTFIHFHPISTTFTFTLDLGFLMV